MCGLVGFKGTVLDLDILTAAAAEAAERGPHSWGWAWFDRSEAGWWRQVGIGPLPPPPAEMADAQVILGHSRLATSGSAPGDQPPPAEGQPLILGPLALAHNGTVADPDRLAGRPVVVDSEALLVAWSERRGDEGALHLADAPQALLFGTSDSLIAQRLAGPTLPAHPLWRDVQVGGAYVCSRPFSPSCHLLPEGTHSL